jgi:hypothetical protein
MIMRYREQLKKQIEYIQNELDNSRTKNIELENQLLKLKLAEMEEDIVEEYDQKTLLKG